MQLNAATIQATTENWIQALLREDKRVNDSTMEDNELFAAYCASIQYTAKEVTQGKAIDNTHALGGRPELEGRILCEKLGVRIHVIRIQEQDGAELEHQIIAAEGSKVIKAEEVSYEGLNLIHLGLYNDHFVPLLPTAASVLKLQVN